MTKKPLDFFGEAAARSYDERNSGLAPISQAMLFLTSLALQGLPSRARVLCVGAGTGSEIISLAKTYPGWTFTALDPSAAMLAVCQARLQGAGLLERCEFVHGYVHDLPSLASYNAALSLLVGHFVPRSERLAYYKDITERVVPGGFIVNAEISFDLDSPELPTMLEGWKAVQTRMGATPDALAELPKQLRDVLSVLPPKEVETMLRAAGIPLPVRFFGAFMICGWVGRRP
jgi:tRNA (cmo5U34)-methyltransferase